MKTALDTSFIQENPEGSSRDHDLRLKREHAAAIDLINNMRDASSHMAKLRGRYWSRPKERISADFFCSAEHPRFGWFALVADAAGHGLASAVFTLHAPMLFRESVLLGMSLPAIRFRMHRFLREQQIAGYFVCGILMRIHERDIEIINAGMPDALLLASDGRLAEAFASNCLPLGVDDDGGTMDTPPQRYRLARGETASLLCYSDGLSELGILNGVAFGREGVLSSAREGSDHVFDSLVAMVEQRQTEVHDDVSIAMIPVPYAEVEDAVIVDLPDIGSHTLPHGILGVTAAQRIVENINSGIMLTDKNQHILYVNDVFSQITGYSLDEAIGQTPRILSSGRHKAEFYAKIWEALEVSGQWSGEVWNRRKDGTIYLEWLDLRVLDAALGHGKQYLAVFTDITKRYEQEERGRFLALHDPLTGLANRMLLMDRGQRAISRAERRGHMLAVLFVDIDHFKAINDTLGCDIGDEVLVEIAKRMLGALRDDDTLSRIEGNQFVCLLSDIASRADIDMVTGKLVMAIESPLVIAGHHLKLSASIGMSAYPADGQVFDDLVQRADRAMIRVKLSRVGQSLPHPHLP